MSEYQKPWGSKENIFDWYYTEENDREIIMPIGNKAAVNIILALNAIFHFMSKEEYDTAIDHLLTLTEVIVANAYDMGDKVANDITVEQSMESLDDEIAKILDGDTPIN